MQLWYCITSKEDIVHKTIIKTNEKEVLKFYQVDKLIDALNSYFAYIYAETEEEAKEEFSDKVFTQVNKNNKK